MKLTVLAPATQAELDGAVDWNEERAEGLGLKFMLLVDEALKEELPSCSRAAARAPEFALAELADHPICL